MKYIAMLRGINVSGQKIIKMAELKSLYESLGFNNVVTYIQSGNVVFEAITKTSTKLKDQIEKAIEKKYKFHVPVVIRTKNEMANIINNIPFKKLNTIEDGTKVLITFLSKKPKEINTSNIQQYVKLPEKLMVLDKEAYLHCPNGYGKTKLKNNFIEKKLEAEATTRNWKSVIKLYELSL